MRSLALTDVGPMDTASLVPSLIREAQAGDESAFTRLYVTHAPRLLAVCRGLTGDAAMGEELLQDTFVRAWRNLPRFRGESAFGTWLHRIAVNLLFNDVRSAKRRALRVAIEADLSHANDGPAAVDAVVPAPDDALRMDLPAMIRRLPAGARAVFVLYDIGGYSHGEIAERLGIAEGTSKAHLFRARRLLREMLA